LVFFVGEQRRDLLPRSIVEQIKQVMPLCFRCELDQVSRIIRGKQAHPYSPFSFGQTYKKVALVPSVQAEEEIISNISSEFLKGRCAFSLAQRMPGCSQFLKLGHHPGRIST
jgi:hypothetical protein